MEALWIMTSLFRRSGGAGHHGDVDNEEVEAPPDKQDSSRAGERQVRRLEFSQAMDDFQTMFPDMEQEVIKCVLRANNGAVDPTIDQLLQMSLDEEDSDAIYDSDDSILPEALERALEPGGSDEEPPPIYSPPSYAMHIYDRKHPDDPMPSPPPRFDAQPASSQRPVGSYRNWNPPLLGNLPDDFLRISPQQLYILPRSQSCLTQRSSSSSLSSLSSQPAEPGATLGQVGMETDQGMSLKQYLEDERIALFLQNEEFMRELQRNREFLITLEKGDNSASGSAETCTTITDEALFRDKLKHMGKSTRNKLFELAKVFSEKTKGRKNKKKALLKHQSPGHAASTARLLEDEEGLLSGEGSKFRGPGIKKEDLPQQKLLS